MKATRNDRYDRNFLRLRVVPLLSERWPHFAEAAARSAMLCAEQESLLDELLSEVLAPTDYRAGIAYHRTAGSNEPGASGRIVTTLAGRSRCRYAVAGNAGSSLG